MDRLFNRAKSPRNTAKDLFLFSMAYSLSYLPRLHYIVFFQPSNFIQGSRANESIFYPLELPRDHYKRSGSPSSTARYSTADGLKSFLF